PQSSPFKATSSCTPMGVTIPPEDTRALICRMCVSWKLTSEVFCKPIKVIRHTQELGITFFNQSANTLPLGFLAVATEYLPPCLMVKLLVSRMRALKLT